MSSLPFLRPLTIPEILDRALRLYRAHFVLLVSIPLLAFVPMTVLQMASQLLWQSTQLVILVQNAFVQILVSSALVIAISQVYLAHPSTLGEAYRTATQHFGSAWGASWLMGLAIALPAGALSCIAIALAPSQGVWLVLILVMPVAIFLGTRWRLVLPSILLENLGAQAGLGRSWALTEGVFGKVFGTSFLASMLIVVLATLPQYAISYGLKILLPNTDIGPLIEIVLTQISLILTTPVSIGVTIVLYYDLRVRKEGFDLEMQVQQASAS